jgi:tetratricopeptide (TPR) repeat protein
MADESEAPPLPPTERFEILERIGAGAMGFVHRARDRETGLEVALKMLRGSDPEDLLRLKNEFRALADIVHPNLVRLYDLDTTVSPAFFTMELLHGVPFDAFVRQPDDRGITRVDPERLAGALAQLAEGLATLHRAGRFHRDIKPSNVLVERSGRAVLLDFGLVRSPEGRFRTTGGFSGSPAYMAPEQAWGLAETPLSDWYAVGVMLYECLTGRLPFGPAGGAAALRPPPPPCALAPDTPEALDALVMALLRADPETRPAEEEILARIRGGPTAADAVPALRALPVTATFVGRDAERAVLREALLAASRRGAVSVRVSGASGIGKTALVERFAAEVEAEGGAVVLRARCRPQETVAYAALDGVVDQLGLWLATLPAADRAVLAPPHRAAIERVFPVLASAGFPAAADETPESEPAALRRQAFAALHVLLAKAAERQPLVVWIDDLQWGDEASAPVLLGLMSEPGCPGLLLVLSHRSEDVKSSALLQCLALAPCREVALAPLAESASRALAAQLLGDDGPARANEIAARAGGSPFFLAELAHSAALRASDPVRSGGGVPTVETVVGERLDRLEPDARRLLEVVALAGDAIERGVALRAAGLDERGRPLVSALSHGRLLRLRPRGRDPAVEVYHDRMREGVLEALPEPERRERHRALATTLEATGVAEPDALARHFYGAGELPSAGRYAAVAGARAAESLAFERAAALYRQAIAWAPGDAAQLRSLRTRLADALVDGGRCAEAAPLYLEAAQGAPRAEALELRRRAVEQLLVSGRIDEGLAALRPLLRELRLQLPESPRAAILGALAPLAQVALRRTRWRPRAAADVDPELLTRIDLCYSAARGLLAVDTIRGVYLPCVGLRDALRAGETGRIGRCLAAVGGGVLAPLPGRLSAWGESMLAEARRIAEERGDAYLAGAVEVVSGQRSVVRGEWQAAVDHSAEGIRILEAYGRGGRWERNVAHTALLRGLEELGRFAEIAALVARLGERAEVLGDRFGEMAAALPGAIVDIHGGEPARGRERLRAALARWSQAGFHLQHFYALRVEVLADLHERRPRDAAARLAAALPAWQRSVLRQVSLPRIDFALLQARTALLLAADDPERCAEHLARAEGEARKLAREARADARGHAALLRASAAAVRGDAERAQRELEVALGAFVGASMAALACCAQRQRGVLLAGDEGRALVAQADAELRERGVADPASWCRVQAPGFRGVSEGT